MNMNKFSFGRKSQLTMFILLGIILLFSVAIIIYLQGQIELSGFKEDSISSLTTETQPIKLFVDKCLEDVGISGVYYMGTQGGYINPPLESLTTEKTVIPYYYRSGTNEMPSLATLENQVSDYIEGILPVCTNGFKSFNFDITEGIIRTTTKINEQNILIKVYYPLTGVFNGKEEKLENFVLKVPIRMGYIYDIAKKVVEKQVKSSEWLDLTYLSTFDVNIDILPYDLTSTIFIITDKKSRIENIPYQLFFANNDELNTQPELDFVPDFVLKKGVSFEYTIIATDVDGDAIKFSDDSNLFDINSETGVILFTPNITGVFQTTITASDGKGEQDSTKIIFDIK